ncbi:MULTISPECIES: alpha/beta hydrolase [unclassified Halomonas]|uniref:alpha/beta hydrolase n=1 Tax=unclassified Halomonas TaxID=2609666 RepID=UPI002884811E|nr:MULTISPECIES: alpha/beta hydrolase [unclassified Halomonas]MDT0501588.1 alpha/beta hydrolase [Halomonas sp. PAR7]MDT0511055.1 alpha/beta hydrolase [Halomonas sp. LES1]MDT0592428.1 alpha/beta hydrolase [Halomonas sp. PAR8]
MLFITNRFPTQSIRTRLNRNFTFDLNNNAASNSVFYCERQGEKEYQEIGSSAFLQRLKEADVNQVLIYIHGFSNLPEDVFVAVQEFQALCDETKPGEVLVVPLVWPCDNDLGIVKDYWDDQESADLSGFSFARVLQRFLDWREGEQFKQDPAPCLKRINVLAHSMGNRVLRETLRVWHKYSLPGGVPLLFRNTFLVAADIVNESLEEGRSGELIVHSSRNVTVYFASDDLALRASKASNLRNRIASRRLGHTGPEDMIRLPRNVFAVDCDDVNTLYDFPKGHTYFRSGIVPGKPGVVFQHLFVALESGRVFPEDELRRMTILRD